MDIGTISSAYSAVKAIKELGNSLLDAKIDSEARQRVTEALYKLGEIQDALFYVREDLLRVQEENHALKEKIKQLEDKLEEKEKVIYEKPSYWTIDGENKDGPFCQKCYDADRKLIRLQGGKNDVWSCHECRGIFHGPNYTPPKVRQPKGGSWMSR